jgi:hypothetical protein
MAMGVGTPRGRGSLVSIARLLPVALVALVALTEACGGSAVRVVARTGQKGQIALSGSSEHVHEAVDEFLRKECNGEYTVLDESPSDQGEWKISYRCETGVRDQQAQSVTLTTSY